MACELMADESDNTTRIGRRECRALSLTRISRRTTDCSFTPLNGHSDLIREG
jgi:hypothetical protein